MLVGCGRWGSRVLRALEACCELEVTAVVDSDGGARAKAASISPAATIHDRLDAALAQQPSRAAAAVVATPPKMHAAHAHRLIEAGFDVLVEKPLATSHQAALALTAHARDRGRVAMVGHLLRFHPAIARVVESVAGRTPLTVRSRRLTGSGSPNPLWTLAPHDLSILLALDNSPVVSVAARRGRCIEVELELASGTLFSLEASTTANPERTLQVTHGSTIHVVNELAEKANPLGLQLAHFAACVRQRSTPRTSFAAAARVVELLERIEQAMGTPGSEKLAL